MASLALRLVMAGPVLAAVPAKVPRGPLVLAPRIAAAVEALKKRAWTQAITLLEHEVLENPDSARAHLLLGDAYQKRALGAAKGGPKQDARWGLKAYKTGLLLDPDAESMWKPHLVFQGMARCYELLGRDQEALRAAARAARIVPLNPYPRLHAARLRLKTGDEAGASDDLRTSLRRARESGSEGRIARLVETRPGYEGLDALLVLSGAASDMRDAPADVRPLAAAPAPPPPVFELPEDYILARENCASGQLWRALTHLTEAFSRTAPERRVALAQLAAQDPELSPLQGTARFEQILTENLD